MPAKKVDLPRCINKTIWKNPAIPEKVLAQEGFVENFMNHLDVQRSTDSPSSSDLMSIFSKYNSASPIERDAIDAAFVWFSGYSLASIAAMSIAKDPSKYDEVISKWRKLEKKS